MPSSFGSSRPGASAQPAPSASSRTRDRLIESASDLFARHGFAPIGLDRIIDEVGVTKTTFYNHFASKDELVIAVLAFQHDLQTRELIEDLRRRAPDSPRGRVLAVFDVFDEWFQDPEFNGCIFMNAATEYPIETDPVHVAAVGHGIALQALIKSECEAAGVPGVPARETAEQIFLLLSGALIVRQTAKRRDAAATAKKTAETVLRDALGPC